MVFLRDNWDVISGIITTLIIPSIILGINYLDKRSQERQKSNQEFNQLLLWGVEAIGDLTMANTHSIKSKSVSPETEEAAMNYKSFRDEIKQFKNNQTATTL